ncbi:hypothetical protein ABFS82_13G154900 [Erythranthe guttata]|uniref:GDSL esterase/lipase At5g03980-like n=1 Tax=Erythranthe guttata TaxID=4155 RepID=UPI00064D7A08|nr:PREDICTED: GDSL esterase/lipase At5g03980-like [Erythranthe guttata]|eukprot:XP_012848800.1 PREDICTED: GDSL esterase/lipase At5g03980-like [Erythranthe guttata]
MASSMKFMFLVVAFLFFVSQYSVAQKSCAYDYMFEGRYATRDYNGNLINPPPPNRPLYISANSVCHDPADCSDKLETSLAFIGLVSQNFYNDAILQRKTIPELKSMIPVVVSSAIDIAREQIDSGSQRVIIPGYIPLGCLPIYKTVFQTKNLAAYGLSHCLKRFNYLTRSHNEQLQAAIAKLARERPNAVVIYADFYNAYLYLLRVARHNGFEIKKSCCGRGGDYNYNIKRTCGATDIPQCPDPERHVNFDGVNLSEISHKIMASRLATLILPKLQCRF